MESEFARVRLEFEKGDLDAALNDVEVLTNRAATLGDDWLWRVRLLKAEILVWRGLNEEVLTVLALPVPESLSNRNYAARRLIILGMAQAYTHRYDDSIRNIQTAEKIAATSYPDLIGETYLVRGTIQVDQGFYEDAMKSYEIALQKAREFHQPFLEANAAGSLGYASTWLERYDQANDWYKVSLAYSESFGARSTSAKTLGNLGWSYHELGYLKEALHYFEDAEKLSGIAGLRVDAGYWRLSAGTVKFDQGNNAEARADMLKSLDIAQALQDGSTVTECFQSLALVAIREKQFTEAHRQLDQAILSNAVSHDFKSEQVIKLVSAQLALQEKQYEPAAKQFVALLADKRTPKPLHWEAQAGLATAYAGLRKLAQAEFQYKKAIDTIAAAEDSITHEESRLAFLSNAIRFYDEYVNFLLSQHRTIDALNLADRSRAQTLESGLSPKSKSETRKVVVPPAFRPQEIARNQNATLLFYWLGQDISYLWVITPEKISLFPLPKASEINASARQYLESLDGPLDPLESTNSLGVKMYETLIRPAEKLIPKNSRIIILPDDGLNSINFESLVVSEPKPHFWIEDATISIANSLSLLSRAHSEPPPKLPNLLLFGDPLSPSKEFPRLADAADEIAAVTNPFPESQRTLFLRENAKASAYLSSNPGSFSYLHFATHGTASHTRPLESAIILTREGDAFKLYARDIVSQHLNAYLVTISACNGVGTETFAGEGLIGLSWAFLRAGAHNVVAGLWEVSTASTPQIMDQLYEGLNKGKDPATALRNAKLLLVHSKGTYRRPFYWAALQLYSGS